jgi:hypothetical protein
VRAERYTFTHWGLLFTLAPDTYEIGRTTTDSKGHFSLQTATGYARFLTAATSDGHLYGVDTVKRGETENLRIVAKDRLPATPEE